MAGPKDLDRTLVAGQDDVPRAAPQAPPANPFAAPPPVSPAYPPPPAQPENPFAAPSPAYPPLPAQPVNPFAGPAYPPAPPAPPAPSPYQPPVNPFAPAPVAAPHPQPDPFAPAPAYPPPPHPSPAPAYAPVPPIPPAPVNPFVQAGPQEGPYRGGYPPPAPMPAAVAGQRLMQRPGTIALRPFTVLVSIAAAIYAAALFYNLTVVLTLQPATSLAELSTVTSALSTAEAVHLASVLLVAASMCTWLAVAAVNARRLCADKPRYAPAAAAIAFAIPLLNLVAIGNILADIQRHSHERTQPTSRLIRVFTILVLGALVVRLLLFASQPSATRQLGVMDGVFYVLGFGDPVRFFAMFGGLDLRGAIAAVTFASLAIPALGVVACFQIERAQIAADRRRRANLL